MGSETSNLVGNHLGNTRAHPLQREKPNFRRGTRRRQLRKPSPTWSARLRRLARGRPRADPEAARPTPGKYKGSRPPKASTTNDSRAPSDAVNSPAARQAPRAVTAQPACQLRGHDARALRHRQRSGGGLPSPALLRAPRGASSAAQRKSWAKEGLSKKSNHPPCSALSRSGLHAPFPQADEPCPRGAAAPLWPLRATGRPTSMGQWTDGFACTLRELPGGGARDGREDAAGADAGTARGLNDDSGWDAETPDGTHTDRKRERAGVVPRSQVVHAQRCTAARLNAVTSHLRYHERNGVRTTAPDAPPPAASTRSGHEHSRSDLRTHTQTACGGSPATTTNKAARGGARLLPPPHAADNNHGRN